MLWKEAAQHWRRSWNLLIKSTVNTLHCKVQCLKIHPTYSSFGDTGNSVGALHCCSHLGTLHLLASCGSCTPGWSFIFSTFCQNKSKLPSVCRPSWVFTLRIATSWPSTMESLGCCKVSLSLSVTCRISSKRMMPYRNWKDCIWLSTPGILAFICVERWLTALSTPAG